MFHCIGCNAQIPWDGKSLFSYTCPCGATVFANNNTGAPTLPASLVAGLALGNKVLTHLDDLVGNSDYISDEKEAFISALKGLGSIWMSECEQCRADGTFDRHQRLLEVDRRVEAIRRRRALGELTFEESVQEITELRREQ